MLQIEQIDAFTFLYKDSFFFINTNTIIVYGRILITKIINFIKYFETNSGKVKSLKFGFNLL